MGSAEEKQCNELCRIRCIRAAVLSCAIQIFVLNIFVLLSNVQLFHPIIWLTDTFGKMFSLYTWLSCAPLLSSICLYGILLGKSLCKVQVYDATRFQHIMRTALPKTLIMLALTLIGFFTTWLYLGLLDEDYKNLTFQCGKKFCINNRNTFIILAGLYASITFFVNVHLLREPTLSYVPISQSRYYKIRGVLESTLRDTLNDAILQTSCFLLLHWIMGDTINARLARLMNVQLDSSSTSSLKQPFYALIFTAQVLSSMHLMKHLCKMFLSHEMQFPIQKRPLFANLTSEITLAEVLNITSVPNTQALAAQHLLTLASSSSPEPRLHIYELSLPGGHPYNWNQLSGQCLCLINAFTEDLKHSIENISTLKKPLLFPAIIPNEADTAAKILMRHYNDMNGLRRLAPTATAKDCGDIQPVNEPAKTLAAVRQRIEKASAEMRLKFENVARQLFYTIPGLCYFFGEQDGGKALHLLANSYPVAWLVEGLTYICVASLKEDKYGVVQVTLPEIIKALLHLNLQLEKLSNVHLNGAKLEAHLPVFRNAVARSLNGICMHFGGYMCDLITEQEDMRNLQDFLNFSNF